MAITPGSAMVASAWRMAYDEKLANRIRTLLGRSGEFDERKMFGGIAFMVDGHMCCGLIDKTLMLRVGAEAYNEALRRPHTRMMDFTGRPLKGFIYVDPPGLKTAAALASWLNRGLTFIQDLNATPRRRQARKVAATPKPRKPAKTGRPKKNRVGGGGLRPP
jgi:TfoX/Sxy family transcriptional regulator of competence genes